MDQLINKTPKSYQPTIGLMDLPKEVIQPILRMVLNEITWMRFYLLRGLSHSMCENVDLILKEARIFEIDSNIVCSDRTEWLSLDRYLIKILGKSPCIEIVTIRSYEVHIWILAEALKQTPQVKTINLINCRITGEREMCSPVFDNITELDLTGSRVMFHQMRQLFRMIPKLDKLVYLRPINLRNFIVDHDWSLYGYLDNLKTLSVDLINDKHSDLFIKRMTLKFNQKLEILELNVREVTDDLMSNLTGLVKLERLRLKFLTDSNCVIHFQRFRALKSLELIEISLSYKTRINDIVVENALRLNNGIEFLYLEVNQWSDAYIPSSITIRFFQFLVTFSNIRYLHLKNVNNVNNKCIEWLSRSITIKQLTLENVEGFSIESMEQFIKTTQCSVKLVNCRGMKEYHIGTKCDKLQIV